MDPSTISQNQFLVFLNTVLIYFGTIPLKKISIFLSYTNRQMPNTEKEVQEELLTS